MKVGDRLPVQIEGMDIGEAIIEDIEDGKATLVIPATRLVVQVRQTLDLAATSTPEVDRVFGGLEEGGTDESAAIDAVNDKPTPIEDAPTPGETATTFTQVAPPVDAGRGEYVAPATYNEDVGEGIHSRKSFPGEMD